MGIKPFFIITIDTEGDNLWSTPSEITVKNAEYLPRFQKLCEKYDFRPVYLANYEMACSKTFVEFGREVIRCGRGEIGMHLHAWNTPPIISLTENDMKTQPYLIEYDQKRIREKVIKTTEVLENNFGVKMLSHRAGRWAFNNTYAQVLIENGYKIDCSVTPHINWSRKLGNPTGRGGTNYSSFPEKAYFIDLQEISREGKSPLLEVPMTVREVESRFNDFRKEKFREDSLFARMSNKLWPQTKWMRPNGRNLRSLMNLVDDCLERKSEYIEFMLHSSELMPGGSPEFPSIMHIDKLYKDLGVLFEYINRSYSGATLTEYYSYKSLQKHIELTDKVAKRIFE